MNNKRESRAKRKLRKQVQREIESSKNAMSMPPKSAAPNVTRPKWAAPKSAKAPLPRPEPQDARGMAIQLRLSEIARLSRLIEDNLETALAAQYAHELVKEAQHLARFISPDEEIPQAPDSKLDPNYADREVSEYQYPEVHPETSEKKETAQPTAKGQQSEAKAELSEPSVFEGVPSTSVFGLYQQSHGAGHAHPVEMTAETILNLVERSERMMRDLHKALEQYDMIRTKGHAYDLKHICTTYGAVEMAETCRHLEGVVMEKRWTQAKVLWEVLVQEFTKYQQQL